MKIIDISKSLKHHQSKHYRKNEEVRYIVLHHTFNKAMGEIRDFQALARYHVEIKGYPGISYHYGVSPEGHAYRLLRHDLVRAYHAEAPSKAIYSEWGNHILNKRGFVRPSNHNSLGIVLPGDFSKEEIPEEQWNTAVELCRLILLDHKAYIIGHRDMPGCERQDPEVNCPGIFFDMTKFVSEVRRKSIDDVVTPAHVQRFHSLIQRMKDSNDKETIQDLMNIGKHLRYI